MVLIGQVLSSTVTGLNSNDAGQENCCIAAVEQTAYSSVHEFDIQSNLEIQTVP